MSDPPRSGSIDDAGTPTQCGILNWEKEEDLDVAVIESTLIVEEIDQQRRRLVRKALSVFNIIIEDNHQIRSLVRYIDDFDEFDQRVRQHYRKTRCRLPSLNDPLVAYKSFSRLSIRNLFAQLKSQKSNSEKIESYMRRCVLDPTISKSSLFRDFLTVQREEDSAAAKEVVQRFVNMQATISNEQQHQIRHANSVASEDAQVPDARSVASTSIENRSSYNSKSPVDENFRKTASSLSTLSENPGISLRELARRQQRIPMQKQTHTKTATSIQDFQFIKVLGKGCMGKVILVRERRNGKLLALKAISKEWTVMQREIEHTKSERDILATIAEISHPFLIKLHHSFQDVDQLFLVLDFYVGGDIATQLAKHYHFDAERSRLYIAEILLGLQELHRLGVLYRDLKPENILIAADGHIVLTDFGLSKQFPTSILGDEQRTNTFCGTAEYLAPEILRAEPYSYEVDFWSLGTLLYEFLTGITPFWAETHTEMYRRVLEDALTFPEDFDPVTADFIDGLLQRDPALRLGAGPNGPMEICSHAYFDDLDWDDVYSKRITPPYIPNLKSDMDFSNFDDTFLQMVPRISNPPGKIILTSDIQDIFEGYSYTESVLESDRFTTTSESEELDSGEYNRYERQSIEEPADNYQFDAVDTDSAISGKHTSHGVWSNEMADHIMPTIDSSDDELQHYGVETHASAKKRANESSTNELRSMSIQQPRVYPDDGSSSSIGGYSDQERKRFTKRRNTIDIEPTTTEAVETQGFSVPTLASTQGTSVFSSVHKIDKTENHSCAIDRQTPHVDTTTTYPGPIAESSDDESMEDLPQSATSEPSNLETMAAIVPDFDSEKNLDLELPIYKVIDIHAKSNPHNTPASTPPSSNIRFSSISATFPVFRRKSKKLSGYQ
ncbi:kinase-like domain-containing protein [Umbelopsis sp. AD052]|nr:kinase-like domain-containing protein [Umbelopsis sp. AD052]